MIFNAFTMTSVVFNQNNFNEVGFDPTLFREIRRKETELVCQQKEVVLITNDGFSCLGRFFQVNFS